ncbi:MAG: 3-hydroxyacyl-CoA dehydrogenase family protein [Anaerolineae bacterium]
MTEGSCGKGVLVAGLGRLADELADLVSAAGHPVARWPASADEEVSIAVDANMGSPADKRQTVEALESVLSDDAVLLTACLAASTTEIASFARHPERVVGFAALPPLDEGTLMEVARGVHTSEEALRVAVAFIESVGREAVEVRDQVGLVLPRIVCCLINETAFALGEGVAGAEDIDTGMRLGMNFPRGPLAWGDLMGLDVVYAVVDGLQRAYREDRYRPAPLLRQKVLAGQLGVATGQGFYDRSDEDAT